MQAVCFRASVSTGILPHRSCVSHWANSVLPTQFYFWTEGDALSNEGTAWKLHGAFWFFTTRPRCQAHCKDGVLQKSKSKVRKKADQRSMNHQMHDCVSQQLSESAPLTLLAENESFCSYQRKCLSQSFQKLPPKKRARYETLSQEECGLGCRWGS